MRIQRIQLLTKELKQLKEFYTHSLGLPLLESSQNAFTIAAGQSVLSFMRTEQDEESPFYHFAFDIPGNQIAASMNWLSTKKIALNILPNQTYTIYSNSWEATSIYFTDPSGNIVEFIARHSLNNEQDTSFSSSSLLNISEIGLVVDDVPGTKELLKTSLGLDEYKENHNSFAAVGDETGLFILSARHRVWLGSDKKAAIFRTEVTIEGNNKGTSSIGSYPYKIIVN